MNINEVPLILAENLSVKLSNQPIFESLSFVVKPKTIHAIIGSNGAGKTTLMRALLGEMPHEGKISFCFQAEKGIGYVPQFIEFDHSLPITVGDFFHLMLTRKPIFLGRSEKLELQIISLLGKTNCDYLIDRPMGSLSGGELCRVLVAQALKKRPAVLLMDEPESSMDEASTRDFEDLLVDLRDLQGVTIVLVAHDLAMVERISDHVTCIKKATVFVEKIDCLQQHNSSHPMVAEEA